MKRATAGRTAAHVEVESTPSPDSSTTVGPPSPLHSMNMPWPSTSNVPAGGVLAAFGAGAPASPPQPASTAKTANAARPRIAPECRPARSRPTRAPPTRRCAACAYG